MKKLIAAVLALVLVLGFSTCERSGEVINPEESNPAENEEYPEEAPDIQEVPSEKEEEPAVSEEIPEGEVVFESGKASGTLCVQFYDNGRGDILLSGETVGFSFTVPEGWKAETLKEGNAVYSFSFETHESNDNRAFFVIYKDDGNIYDELLAMNSLWVGIDEYTYHEVEGNFSKGSYIHFSYPSSDKYDTEEGIAPVYGRFYQLQFDGYVVAANIYIRIDSEENTLFDEKLCDEFISSIMVG